MNIILNPFPHLLSYSFFAPTILRLLLGLIFISFGFSKVTKEKSAKAEMCEKIGLKPGLIYVLTFGIIEMLSGAMLVLGLYTQIAALAISLILLGTLLVKKKHPELFTGEPLFYFTLLIIALSLLITGAGAHAIDVPL